MPVINEIGNTYGYLTVIQRAEKNDDGRAYWICQCRCGNQVTVLGKHLRNGNTKSCGCYQKERAAESNMNRGGDLTGRRFGKLVVLKETGFTTDSYGKRRRLWECQCDCGNICQIQGIYLSHGDTQSCGCINSKGNMTINRILTCKGINYESEYSFTDFVSDKNRRYRYDFALLDNKNELLGLIEYQGSIHFSARNKGWNNQKAFEERVKRDELKKQYCDTHNIKLYYITYLENIEERLKEIINELYS